MFHDNVSSNRFMHSQTVLIIEDQKSMAMLLKSRLEKVDLFNVQVVHTMFDAKAFLQTSNKVQLCVTDLNLPDAPNAEIVDLLKLYKLTTVVLTGSYSDEVRDRVFNAHVADYIVKDGLAAIEYAVSSVIALMTNHQREVWMVSQNLKLMQRTKAFLRLQRYQLKVFDSYDDTLKLLDTELPDLIVLDQIESGINQQSIYGFLNSTRSRFSDNELPILSFSYPGKETFAIKLLKYGVSDLIPSDYFVEELFLRVRKGIEHSSAYKEVRKNSQTDMLTQLYNRRYFYEKANLEWQEADDKSSLFVFMIDIDHFKQVNDQFGHLKGDEVISFVAAYLKSVFENLLVARYGGEEFIVFGKAKSQSFVRDLAENFRVSIESQSEVSINLYLTVSGGLHFGGDSLETAISEADKKLYQAKEAGRNNIM